MRPAMLPDDLTREDQQLKVGALVTACWTRGGFSYQQQAVVVRLERLWAEVRLLVPIPADRESPGLHSLLLPRYANFMAWSARRCLRAVRG